MLGINGTELIILAVIAVIILGPERLPDYAAQLARFVKQLRSMAAGAKEQLREEVGDEIVDMDWRKLDPRQYDPRRIIKEALLDEEDDLPQRAGAAPAVAAGAAAGTAVKAAARPAPAKTVERLQPGETAPYDIEAT
ncbi:twin-arginine translocation protein TatB [Arthrobacter crystallopoietes BAB-32]|uniref:Sec-independent protein translocase protein TatB n=1 Tax=Arthrobacter crystallopoietes BAB-32 TaxID=1246476 RepID=N1UWN4_9MICC|nr:twin-arginine translocase TatA/TatE family subunit [Arthrobacter crystallopoietes]EMY33480.1 twin-arginine translocation protein TatB [Arthrobacter crystallopoietes BAB-32]